MDKKQTLETIKLLREISPKRKFTQSVDIIINLKGLNIKKSDQNVDETATLVHVNKKEIKICALVGPALEKKAACCTRVILNDSFSNLKLKEIKQLVKEFDYFVAQADIMPQVATTFGKVLGPKKKMPNPKLGSIIPPTGDVEPTVTSLQKTVQLLTRNEASIKVPIGQEDFDDENIAENAVNIYNAVLNALPQGKQNIKAVFFKLTMGPSVKLGETKEEFTKRNEEKKSKKPTEAKKKTVKKKSEGKKTTTKKEAEPKTEETKESKAEVTKK
ncbi:hypothetical protein CL622_03835 [archaeon]|nr:hypothetical protein [archaeon]